MTRYDHYTDKFINDDLISREESLMCLTSEYLEGQEYKLDDEIHKFIKRIQNISSVPAIPIPEGATNGDMVKMIFPDSKIIDVGNQKRIWLSNQYLINCLLDWWNSPYKRGETE